MNAYVCFRDHSRDYVVLANSMEQSTVLASPHSFPLSDNCSDGPIYAIHCLGEVAAAPPEVSLG